MSMTNHIEIVKFLIEKGANINIVDENFTTALSCATVANHTEIVKILIESMDGEVWCESTYGEGSNFRVKFKLISG